MHYGNGAGFAIVAVIRSTINNITTSKKAGVTDFGLFFSPAT